MKLGVICDGISNDLRHAVDVMDEISKKDSLNGDFEKGFHLCIDKFNSIFG